MHTPMNHKKQTCPFSKSYVSAFALLVFVLLTHLGGCAQKPVKKIPEHLPPKAEKPVEPEPKQKDPEKQTPLMEILMAEARNFAAEDNYQDALLVYNQVLSLAEPQNRETILSDIEKVLAQTDPQILEEFTQIKNLSIPKPLLYFWLGKNLANQKNYDAAKTAVIYFIHTFPDHPYIMEAQNLLADLAKTSFQKKTIGCLLPLSGKYHIFGERALQGIHLALQDLYKTHGINFQVIIKDTQSDPQKSGECVDELFQEGVMGIIGPLLAPETAGARAQELKIPMIALTQKEEFPLQGDYLFSNFITPQMQVQSLAAYTFMKLGITTVAILYPNERYGIRYKELFLDAVNHYKGIVAGVESYDGDNTDFSIPIKKLIGKNFSVPGFSGPQTSDPELDLDSDGQASEDPGEKGDQAGDLLPQAHESAGSREVSTGSGFQALFIPDSLSRINLILPQLAYHDAKGMVLLGTNLWHQESLLTEVKGFNRNTVITDGYFGESQNPVTAAFDRSFKELYENSPGFLEAVAYDTVFIFFSTAMDEGVDSRESLKNALQESRVFEGVTGKTFFDQTGSPHKELFLITVKKGKFMEISH